MDAIQAGFRTDKIRTTQPTPQDEMRAGMSYFHETIWKGVPKFLRQLDTALKNIGIDEHVPYDDKQLERLIHLTILRTAQDCLILYYELRRETCYLMRMKKPSRILEIVVSTDLWPKLWKHC
uniref:Uncharacterized protein n=1 Tax=Oryza glumipatula TaxID=40148 RepID=A0A0D9YDY0_9ORYZ